MKQAINNRYENNSQTALDSLKINEQQFIEWKCEKASISKTMKERFDEIIKEENLKKILKSDYSGKMVGEWKTNLKNMASK